MKERASLHALVAGLAIKDKPPGVEFDHTPRFARQEPNWLPQHPFNQEENEAVHSDIESANADEDE